MNDSNQRCSNYCCFHSYASHIIHEFSKRVTNMFIRNPLWICSTQSISMGSICSPFAHVGSIIQILLAPSSPIKCNLNPRLQSLTALSCQTLITWHFSRKHLHCLPLPCFCPGFPYASLPFPFISPSEHPPSEYSAASPESLHDP